MPHYSTVARGGKGGGGDPCAQGAPSSFTPRILQTLGGSRLLIVSSSSLGLWPKRLLPGAVPAAELASGRLCTHRHTPKHRHTHTQTRAHTRKHTHTHTHTQQQQQLLGPQNNQARMAFSPGDAAEIAQVAIRAARVSAKFCPFILGSGTHRA